MGVQCKKKGTYTLEELAILNEEAQKIKKRAETSAGIPKLQTARAAHSNKGVIVEPFRRINNPAVKLRAQEWLFTLLNKHKAKMEAKSPIDQKRYRASLIAVATHMAMRDFGLIISCIDARRKGRKVSYRLDYLHAMMGIRESRSDAARAALLGDQ